MKIEIILKPVRMKFRLFALGVDYDWKYGLDERTGWSIIWRYHYCVVLEKCPIKAIYKALFSRC